MRGVCYAWRTSCTSHQVATQLIRQLWRMYSQAPRAQPPERLSLHSGITAILHAPRQAARTRCCHAPSAAGPHVQRTRHSPRSPRPRSSAMQGNQCYACNSPIISLLNGHAYSAPTIPLLSVHACKHASSLLNVYMHARIQE